MPIVDIKPKKPSYPSITELGGRIQDLCRYVDKDDLTWGATNASIAVDGDGNYSISLRSSNYVITPKGAYTVINSEKGIKSNFWFSDLDKDFNIINLKKIDTSRVGIKIERGLIPYEIGVQIHAENCEVIKSSIDNLKIFLFPNKKS